MARTEAITRKSRFMMFFGRQPLAKVRAKEFRPRDKSDKPSFTEGIPAGALLAIVPFAFSVWSFIVAAFTQENKGKSIGSGIAGLLGAAVLTVLGYLGRVNTEDQEKDFFAQYSSKSDPTEKLSELILPSQLTNQIDENIKNVTQRGIAFNAFGEKGLGKTHTARAITNLLKKGFPQARIDTVEVSNKFINEQHGIFGGKSAVEKLKEILVHAYQEAEKENSGCKDGEIKCIKHLIFEEARLFEYGTHIDELKPLLDELRGARGVVVTFTNNSKRVDNALSGRDRLVNLRYDYPTQDEKVEIFKKHMSQGIYFSDEDIKKAILPDLGDDWNSDTSYSGLNKQEKELVYKIRNELPKLTGFEIKEIAEEVARKYSTNKSDDLKELALKKLVNVLLEKMNVSTETDSVTIRPEIIEKIIRMSWTQSSGS